MATEFATPPAGSGDPEETSLRGDEHRSGLADVTARVVRITRPSAGLLRVVLDIGEAARDSTWARPNVAVRIGLDDAEARSRVYTVRDADLDAARITLDVVQHGADSPMMRWSTVLRVGDAVELTGPRPHFLPPEGGARVALFADDSALPALYEILRGWPEGRSAIAVVQSDDDVAVGELVSGAQVRIEQVSAEPGSLVRSVTRIADPTDLVVWAAGERDEMRSLRAYFRSTLGLAKDRTAVFGYWRRGVSNTEIDRVRLRTYNSLTAQGKTLADLDDLALEV